MPFVLDASVATTWAFEDEITPYADQVLAALDTESAVVPAIWPLEVTNVLVLGERRGRIRPAATVEFLALLQSLPISVVPSGYPDMNRIVDLARMYGLTSYDASYLDLAMSRAVPFATLDVALRAAAERAGVSILAG
jgi:predicted nucleic acid-binding protein